MAVAPFDVLCCRITVGDSDPGNPMAIQNPIVLTEVQEVEIVETYKKLIGTATVRFPNMMATAMTVSNEKPQNAIAPDQYGNPNELTARRSAHPARCSDHGINPFKINATTAHPAANANISRHQTPFLCRHQRQAIIMAIAGRARRLS